MNEALVTTDWVDDHLDAADVRIVQVNRGATPFAAGHIPGARHLDWHSQLQDATRRDIVDRAAFERLLSDLGIRADDTVVLYGDDYNWYATFAYWVFALHGHRDVRLMDGGRTKWRSEDDKELTTELLDFEPTTYVSERPRSALRATLTDVTGAAPGATNLVDVRGPDEFDGHVIAPPGATDAAQRGGHIPGAVNVPWARAINADGTFRDTEALRSLYSSASIDPDRPTITYSRNGLRASHTWFALKVLLGLDHVMNYDGSWTEYGNLVGVPIEK